MNKPKLKDVNYLLCGLAASRQCLKDIYRLKYNSNAQSLSTTLYDIPAMILLIKGHSKNADLTRRDHYSITQHFLVHDMLESFQRNKPCFFLQDTVHYYFVAWGLRSQERNNTTQQNTILGWDTIMSNILLELIYTWVVEMSRCSEEDTPSAEMEFQVLLQPLP